MLEGDVTRIQHLRNTNHEFVALERRHDALEHELDDLMRRRILTPSDEIRKKTVQKQKLVMKDRMYDMLRRSSPAEAAS
ncbi:MAG TPA: YdcH family protein [Nitrospiria bacterium]|nr:YdcH family protein [Nitrospiria bacterium]